MQIVVTKSVEETIELQLPAFFKYGNMYVKVVSENKYITVDDYSFSLGIQVYANRPNLRPEYESISEDQFETALQDVSEKIREQIQASLIQLKTA